MNVTYFRVPNISAALLLDFGEIFLHFTLIRKYISVNKKKNDGKLCFLVTTLLLGTPLIIGALEIDC